MPWTNDREFKRLLEMPIGDLEDLGVMTWEKMVKLEGGTIHGKSRKRSAIKFGLKVLSFGGSIVGQTVAGASAVTGPLGLAVTAITFGLNQYLQNEAAHIVVGLDSAIKKKGDTASEGTIQAIAFAYRKISTRQQRSKQSKYPIRSLIPTIIQIAHRGKANKGVGRRTFARILWTNAMSGEECAILACQALVGQKGTKHLGVAKPNTENPCDKAYNAAKGFYCDIEYSMSSKG